ncbi:MAG: Uma2 family endonuclease [Chloroflexi bacterium]|nr:Uma2 family endonuclease [Chloroflexota bacterium]
MAVRELPRVNTKTYTVDDVWALECDPANEGRYFYLIDGELHEDPMPNWTHSELAALIAYLLLLYVKPRKLGSVNVELSAHPPDTRRTLLVPDIAFTRAARVPEPRPKGYAPLFPDIAIEIKSPSNSMSQLRRKAEIYLRHGSEIVWLVLPEQSEVEEWRLDDEGQMQQQIIDHAGKLGGGTALPGFELELSLLFPPDNNGEDHAG